MTMPSEQNNFERGSCLKDLKNNTTADEWLNQAFRASLNLSSASSDQNSLKYSIANNKINSSIYNLNSTDEKEVWNNFSRDQISHSYSMPEPNSFTRVQNLIGPQTTDSNRIVVESGHQPPPQFPPPPLPPGLLKRMKDKLRTDEAATTNSNFSELKKQKSLSSLKNSSSQLLENSTLETKPLQTIKLQTTTNLNSCQQQQMNNSSSSNNFTPKSTITYKQQQEAQQTQHSPTTKNSITTSNTGHSRKSSAALRMSIEYQILEETDVPPQSPPGRTLDFLDASSQKTTTKNNRFDNKSPASNDENDPFDVQWLPKKFSAIFAKKISEQKQQIEQQSSIATTIISNNSNNITCVTTTQSTTNPFYREGSVNV